jgi:hypothetical protein
VRREGPWETVALSFRKEQKRGGRNMEIKEPTIESCFMCWEELTKGKVKYDGKVFCRRIACLETYKTEQREKEGEEDDTRS